MTQLGRAFTVLDTYSLIGLRRYDKQRRYDKKQNKNFSATKHHRNNAMAPWQKSINPYDEKTNQMFCFDWAE